MCECAGAENIFNFTRPHPSNTNFTRCVGNAQGPERMHECPEEFRKSELFILNANGASLLLEASFGVQGSSKQKSAVEIGRRWKHRTRRSAFAAARASRGGPPCTHGRYPTQRVGDFEAPGHTATRRGRDPEGAESGSGASVSAQSLSETLYLEAHLGGPRERIPCPQFSSVQSLSRVRLSGLQRPLCPDPLTAIRMGTGTRKKTRPNPKNLGRARTTGVE